MIVGGQIARIGDHRRGDAGTLQHLGDLRCIASARPLGERSVDVAGSGKPQLGRREQRLPLAVPRDGDGAPAVAAVDRIATSIYAVRHQRAFLAGVADRTDGCAARRRDQRRADHARQRLELRQIDDATLRAPQRRDRSERRRVAGDHVRVRVTPAGGPTIGVAHVRREAELSLQSRTEADAIALRPSVAEAGHVHHFESRIDRQQRRVVEAPVGEHARAEVLDQQIGAFDPAAQLGASGRIAHVDDDAALAAVQVAEHTAAPVCRRCVRALDLRHSGTVVGEHPRRERTGDYPGQIEDTHSGERLRRLRKQRVRHAIGSREAGTGNGAADVGGVRNTAWDAARRSVDRRRVEEGARCELWVVGGVAQIGDRRERQAAQLGRLGQLGGNVPRRPLAEVAKQLFAVLGAVCGGVPTRLAERRVAAIAEYPIAQRVPVAHVRDQHCAAARRQRLKGPRPVQSAAAARHLAALAVQAGHMLDGGQGAFLQRDVDELAAPAALAHAQREQSTDGAVQPCRVVGLQTERL